MTLMPSLTSTCYVLSMLEYADMLNESVALHTASTARSARAFHPSYDSAPLGIYAHLISTIL